MGQYNGASASVLVLMSSYNGERYIREQIDSILAQKGVNVSLLVRDDGSTDRTTAILKSYERNHDNVKCIYDSNIGVKRSFLSLISVASDQYDYYALSDQDDIWLDDKLLVGILALHSHEPTKPCLYGSSVFLFSNDKVGEKAFSNRELSFGNFLFKNYFPGCTIVFNQKLKRLVGLADPCQLSATPLHDHWMTLVCLGCEGKLFFDDMPHIYYRQHSGNVVGNRSFLDKIKGNGLFGKSEHVRLHMAEDLLRFYGPLLGSEEQKLTIEAATYRSSLKNRFGFAFDSEAKPVAILERVVAVLLVLLAKY